MEPNYLEIGQRLQEARKISNLTQQALADSIGFSVSYTKNIERGKKPSIEYLLAVADKCHVSISWLLIGNQDLESTDTPELKKEIIFDSDTRDMIEVIKMMMSNPDPEMRTWAKVQFRRTFPEFFQLLEQKKEHA